MAETPSPRSSWPWVIPLALLLGLSLATALAVRSCMNTAGHMVRAPADWAERLARICTEAHVQEEVRITAAGALPTLRFQFLEETVHYHAVRTYERWYGDCEVEVNVPATITWFVDLEDSAFDVSCDAKRKVVHVTLPSPQWNKPALDPKDLLAGSRITKSDVFVFGDDQKAALQKSILHNLGLYLDGQVDESKDENSHTKGLGSGQAHLKEVRDKARLQMDTLIRNLCVRQWQGETFPEDWKIDVHFKD